MLLKVCLWKVAVTPSSRSNSKIAVTWACALRGPYDRHNVAVKIIAEHMPMYSIRWYCEVTCRPKSASGNVEVMLPGKRNAKRAVTWASALRGLYAGTTSQ